MEKEEYGQSLKTIRFSVTDDDHARLLISLRNNNLPASQFFRAVIDGMIEKNPDILSFVPFVPFVFAVLEVAFFAGVFFFGFAVVVGTVA